jgi:hypothetical protein
LMQKHSAIIGPSGAAIVIRFLDPEPATDPFRFGRIQTPVSDPEKTSLSNLPMPKPAPRLHLSIYG